MDRTSKITKREARKLFAAGQDPEIGGHDYQGCGAFWKMSEFKSEADTFDGIVYHFERYYCRGIGRLKMEFRKNI